MTRPSKRELERELTQTAAHLGDAGEDGPEEIVIRTTVVGSSWSPPDDSDTLDEGEERTYTRTLEVDR